MKNRSGTGGRRDPYALERELRSRLTELEYRVLQARLTGATKAIVFLRDRAPDLLPMMFGDSVERAKALPVRTQAALAGLIDELLTAAATTEDGVLDRKRLLQIVRRVNSHV